METLDQLLAQTELFAEQQLRQFNRLHPVFCWLGKDGPGMAVPAALTDEDDKNAFVSMSRLFCIANAATACVTAVEAWISTKSPKEVMPSEDFDRKECVILMGEDRVGAKHKMLPIVRSSNGNFFGFGEPKFSDGFFLTGRFTKILPSREPDIETQRLAQIVIELQCGRAKAKPPPKSRPRK